MDRVQLLLLGLPLFLFCSDIFSLFSPPAKPSHHRPPVVPPLQQHQHQHHPQTLEFPSQKTGGVGYGTTVNINFCSSCSYRGNAETIKKMLDTSFPGMEVILANYPPALPKRLLSKVVPVFQTGVMVIVMAGEHIFPRLGYMTPPSWYFSMRQNRFGTIATAWLLGNVLQSTLQSSGAFEVYCNGELVFSKLKEQRFPGEIELRDLLSSKLASSRAVDGVRTDGLWA